MWKLERICKEHQMLFVPQNPSPTAGEATGSYSDASTALLADNEQFEGTDNACINLDNCPSKRTKFLERSKTMSSLQTYIHQ